jgi:hypothetical protein
LVGQRLPEAYRWLLVPMQEVRGRNPDGQQAGVPLEWERVELKGTAESLAARASSRLVNDGALIVDYASSQLRQQLDRIPLWRGDQVPIRQLWEDFAQYLYLPRLQDGHVLAAAVQQGCGKLTWETETFAYAEGWDEVAQRYVRLRAGSLVDVQLDTGMVVKPEAARRQLDADEAERRARQHDTPADGKGSVTGGTTVGAESATPGATGTAPPDLQKKAPRRFYGTVRLDPLRVSRDASTIAQEVVQNLTSLVSAEAEITLEIQVRVPDGVPDHVVRTVTENCRVLKFTSAEFEST